MGRQSAWKAEDWRRWACSILLLTIATTSIASTTTFTGGAVQWHSPTRTYQGYLSIVYYGTYHFVMTTPQCGQALLCLAPDEGVFYLETDNGYLIQLIFTCGLQDCFEANQLPLPQGARIYVKGTLIEPSQWQPELSKPNLEFFGDLYVLQYHTV